MIIAGGGDELLADPDDLLIPGDEGAVFGPYPLEAMDAYGKSRSLTTALQYPGQQIVTIGCKL